MHHTLARYWESIFRLIIRAKEETHNHPWCQNYLYPNLGHNPPFCCQPFKNHGETCTFAQLFFLRTLVMPALLQITSEELLEVGFKQTLTVEEPFLHGDFMTFSLQMDHTDQNLEKKHKP